VTTWVFVTAHNPRSVPRSAADNESAQGQLEATVRSQGWVFFQGYGLGQGGAWPPEPSLLVLGPGVEQARDLGRSFGQAAVVVGELGGQARLLWMEEGADPC